MDESEETILYETRRHASRPFIPNYPPLQTDEGAKGSILSLLSVRGVSQLKDKWNKYKQPRKLKKLTSLFISPRGERVAVAAGNQITILQKEDDYLEPCGIFAIPASCSSFVTFTMGTWSDSHEVLGVIDDTDTLYFIKANGEEITRISSRQLKVSLPILYLIAEDDSDAQSSCLCNFTVVTSDGSLQNIEMSRDPNKSIHAGHLLHNSLAVKGQFHPNVVCLDYHPELQLLVGVSSSVSNADLGSSNLSLWHRSRNINLEHIFSLQFEGFYCKPKGYGDILAYPKVLISPQAKYIATLDVTGFLHIFELNIEHTFISKFHVTEKHDSKVSNVMSSKGMDGLSDIVDFTWWSGHVLAIAKKNGIVTMLDICNGLEVQKSDAVYSVPVLERVQQCQGNLFLLDGMPFEEREKLFDCKMTDSIQQITEDKFDQSDISRFRWILVSFSRRSVLEMFNVLLSNRKYEAALKFADCHGLDKDEVLKSQWLNSTRGVNEIGMYLSKVRDKVFIFSECVERVGPTEDAAKALLEYGLRLTSHYRFSEPDDESSQIWDFRMARLRLLQFRDRLETYLGINMGRFSEKEYTNFRVMPINEVGVALAESGKIGALNLLFKRHPYSLASFTLEILAAIPETLPVQTYSQLLPGSCPPTSTAVREEDWVECKKMINFMKSLPKDHEIGLQIRTEPIVKKCLGYVWPLINEISSWYKNRAKDIDNFSGQLDNCLCLLDSAKRKGITELRQFHEDVTYLYQLTYSDDSDSASLSLATWEQLSDYDKFRTMLKGVKDENVVKRLHDKAVPFMRNRFHYTSSMSHVIDNQVAVDQSEAESYLVRWLKETASENKLDICLIVLEEGCQDLQSSGLFKDEVEAVDCALQCIYLCTLTDRWSTMTALLSKLPHMQGSEICDEDLKRRLKLAEGHVEVGRLLAFYQVPKPISFFLESHADEKSVKQILRLILSKFIRRQPGRSDNDWANMWRDMQCIRDKAFPFLDPEYMLMEFCRGLLKAGKFSLARNYLKGTSSVVLASEKAENLVIQAAREYFFSASSLSCPEIWKAKKCLNLLPSSASVKAECDIIDALTVKLPSLGVMLLPVQFRQIKDPMEIIKMVITSQSGAYLHVDELIEIAKLLGLSSSDDISAVQEAIAREAAVAGDLQLALDLCLVLAKKGHGPVWDLCAAIARGPALENMDIYSRKQLLGFALSHCDEESISELLHAWKDLDMQGQCEMLMMSTGSNSPDFSIQGSSIITHSAQKVQDIVDLKMAGGTRCNDQEKHVSNIKEVLSLVAKNLSVENGSNWESDLIENGKVLSFAALQLPWLLELSKKAEYSKKSVPGLISGELYVGVKTQAVLTILSWLARNSLSPKDNVIALLAKSIIESPAKEEEDVIGCSILLNLVDPFYGVEAIEEQLKRRKDYHEISSIMNVGMMYSSLHNTGVKCECPTQRRELLLRKFKEKHTAVNSDEMSNIDEVQSTFWREWKLKLEEQKCAADQSRVLEKIIPGVDSNRFLSGDFEYIGSTVLSLIVSVKTEKQHIFKDVLKLVNTYGLNLREVLLQYLSSLLVSEAWTNDDIMCEISEIKGEITGFAVETIKAISLNVYPAIDGCDKLRLAIIFELLSDCYLQLEVTQNSLPIVHPDQEKLANFGIARFYKVLEQECRRISFVENLNFKNIAGVSGLNFECFSHEVYTHIDDSSLEALAKMVETLVSIHIDPMPKGLISWQDVYKHYVLKLLQSLETKARTDFAVKSPENLQRLVCLLEQSYDSCRIHIRVLTYSDALDMIKRYFTVIIPVFGSYGIIPDTSAWQDCLIVLLNFWMKLTEEMKEITSHKNVEQFSFSPDSLMSCLKILMRLVMEDIVSPSQGWGTLASYINDGLFGDSASETFIFCRSMVFSGCGFGAITEVFSGAVLQTSTISSLAGNTEIQDLPHLYLNFLEPILQDLVISESEECQNLYNLLSSLSKLEGDLEDLKLVRRLVWERIAQFSGNLQLPGPIRVHILELMQFLAGKTMKGFSADIQSNVTPWEGWDDGHFTSGKGQSTTKEGLADSEDTSNRFTSTLVALKSSQLVAAISPTLDITPDDLLNVETAVSCFLKLSGIAHTDSHIDSLLAVLGEWEGLFMVSRDEDASAEAPDSGNHWNNDDWDEGWESFQDIEPPEKEMKPNVSSIHPLHVCWMEIFNKLAMSSRFKDVLRLIDQSNGILLDENEVKNLSHRVLETDPVMALKLVVLLPYQELQLHCLASVESKLKLEGLPDSSSSELELLVLLLFSGIISKIMSKSSYGSTFSYICYLVGSFSHKCQAAQLSGLMHKELEECKVNEKELLLFRRVVFPNFISELVKADHLIVAGFMVTKFMHTNASLRLVNIAESSLSRFLERQLDVLSYDNVAIQEASSHETLKNSISGLIGKLETQIQSVLPLLSVQVLPMLDV